MVNSSHIPESSPAGTDPISFDAAYPVVYGYLLRRCGQIDVSEELTAATFVSALSSDDAEQWPLRWLLVIARNKLIDHWRRASRASDAEERLRRQPRPADIADIDVVDDRLEIAGAMGLLLPDHRAVIVLRHLDDLSVAQCAAELGRSVRATESLLGRAEAAFRAAWRHRETGGDS